MEIPQAGRDGDLPIPELIIFIAFSSTQAVGKDLHCFKSFNDRRTPWNESKHARSPDEEMEAERDCLE